MQLGGCCMALGGVSGFSQLHDICCAHLHRSLTELAAARRPAPPALRGGRLAGGGAACAGAGLCDGCEKGVHNHSRAIVHCSAAVWSRLQHAQCWLTFIHA